MSHQTGTRYLISDIPRVYGYNIALDWYQIPHIRYQVFVDTMSHQTGTRYLISDIPRVYGYNIALDWYHISYQIFHVFMDTMAHKTGTRYLISDIPRVYGYNGTHTDILVSHTRCLGNHNTRPDTKSDSRCLVESS